VAGGQQITSSQGSVTQSLTVALVGLSIASAAGTLIYAEGDSLTGSESTVSVGDVGNNRLVGLKSRKVGGGSASRSITGISTTAEAGTLVKVLSPTLSGLQASTAQGSLSKTRSVALVGSSVSALSGAVSGSGGATTNKTFFTLVAPTTGTYPFSVGIGFKKGDLSTNSIGTDLSQYQVNVLRTWNDGSVKHALISGLASLTANVTRTVNVNNGASPTGTNLTLANLQSVNPTSTVQWGSIGTVSLSLTSPVRQYISGPRMSEWHFRSDIGNQGSVWWHVRLFSDNRVYVRVICENGYLDNGSGATTTAATQTYIPTITIGGTTVYNNGGANLTHYKRTRYYAEGWVGGNPSVTPLHDVAYLRAAKLVPNYGWTAASASALNGLTQTYTPMARGDFFADMGSTGYQPGIGLLNNWDALYCATGDARAYRSVLANASSLNAYAIGFRGKTSQRPIKPSDFGTWNVDGPFGGGTDTLGAGPNTWEYNHHPSGGYLAYLLTGDYWHYETMLLQSAACYLAPDTSLGQGTSRIMDRQVRGTAWALRTVGQLCAIAPDADIGGSNLVESYRSLLANNYSHWLAVSQSATAYVWSGRLSNAYSSSWGLGEAAPWMTDFWLQTNGHISDAEPLATMTALNSVRDYMYRWVVSRLGATGTQSEYGFVHAGQYTIKVSADNSDGASYQNWETIYTQTIGSPNTVASNTLLGESGSDPSIMATGYWGNLLPAISYASDHGASGASTAYARLTGATNYASGSATFNDAPVFGIKPRSGSLPAWVAALPLWQWYQIPNTALSSVAPSPQPSGNTGPQSKLYAWCGATLKRSGSVYMLGAAGGHNDYGGNEVNALTLNTAVPAWTQLRAPTPNSQILGNGTAYQFYADSRPSSTHTYYATQFFDAQNRMVVFPSPGYTGPASGSPPGGWGIYTGDVYFYSYNLNTGDWDAPGTLTNFPSSGDFTACLCVKHQTTEDVYYSRNYSSQFWRYRPSTNTWTQLSTNARNPWYAAAAIDPTRNRIFTFGSYDPTGPSVIDLNGNSVAASFSGQNADLVVSQYPGAIYDEANDRFLGFFYSGGQIAVRRIHPTTWVVDTPTMTGTPPPTRDELSNGNGIQNSVQYVPELKGFVVAVRYTSNVYFVRTAL
jgi:hypothetical protein